MVRQETGNGGGEGQVFTRMGYWKWWWGWWWFGGVGDNNNARARAGKSRKTPVFCLFFVFCVWFGLFVSVYVYVFVLCFRIYLFVHCTQYFHELFQKTDPARVIQSTPEISHVRQHLLSDVMGSGRKELRHNPWIHRFLFQDICREVQDHIFTVLRTDYLSCCKSVRPRFCLSVFLWMYGV